MMFPNTSVPDNVRDAYEIDPYNVFLRCEGEVITDLLSIN